MQTVGLHGKKIVSNEWQCGCSIQQLRHGSAAFRAMTEEIQSSLEGTQGKFSSDMTGTEGSKINSGGSSLTRSALSCSSTNHSPWKLRLWWIQSTSARCLRNLMYSFNCWRIALTTSLLNDGSRNIARTIRSTAEFATKWWRSHNAMTRAVLLVWPRKRRQWK
ncbi:hypothetical protein PI124_g23901 [Phytophthora idaei]|nr:hypothetical protein PI124_g23901 [Phytophthora idaei]